MKRTVLIQLMTILFSLQLLANGVCIKDATEAIYFKLLSSEVQVEVNNQVSILTTTQLFMNNTGCEAEIKYAFPLYEDASPINLRWYVNGSWNTAIFSPSPQDTTLPGGGDPDRHRRGRGVGVIVLLEFSWLLLSESIADPADYRDSDPNCCVNPKGKRDKNNAEQCVLIGPRVSAIIPKEERNPN